MSRYCQSELQVVASCVVEPGHYQTSVVADLSTVSGICGSMASNHIHFNNNTNSNKYIRVLTASLSFVLIIPGATALTRMFFGAHVFAITLHRPSSAVLLTEYAPISCNKLDLLLQPATDY